LWHYGSLNKSHRCVTNASAEADNYVARQWDSGTTIHELLFLQLKVKVPKCMERKLTF